MLDAVHYTIGIAVDALAVNFLLALVNKVNVPMLDEQAGKQKINRIKHHILPKS